MLVIVRMAWPLRLLSKTPIHQAHCIVQKLLRRDAHSGLTLSVTYYKMDPRAMFQQTRLEQRVGPHEGDEQAESTVADVTNHKSGTPGADVHTVANDS
jgi:hypothetical protein